MERMAKARMKRLASTTTPTRNSVQLRAALDLSMAWAPSGKELTNVGIAGRLEVVRRALEVDLPFPQHQELGAGEQARLLEPAEAELLVIAKDEGPGHVESVAELMGNEDGGDAIQVAHLDDQVGDGGGGDGVEAGGGLVVQHEG